MRFIDGYNRYRCEIGRADDNSHVWMTCGVEPPKNIAGWAALGITWEEPETPPATPIRKGLLIPIARGRLI